jgi:hypothetical protein
LRKDPVYQAFWLLRIGFTVAPIVFGLDKFFGLMADWDRYLAPRIDDIVPGTAHQAMYLVGTIEVVAGLVVAFQPRWGAYLVGAWLLGIIGNLLLIPRDYDIALRDFGLFLGTLTLARLASVDARPQGSAAGAQDLAYPARAPLSGVPHSVEGGSPPGEPSARPHAAPPSAPRHRAANGGLQPKGETK